jgi:hypothetical protein
MWLDLFYKVRLKWKFKNRSWVREVHWRGEGPGIEEEEEEEEEEEVEEVVEEEDEKEEEEGGEEEEKEEKDGGGGGGERRRLEWRPLLLIVINLPFPHNAQHFMSSLEPIRQQEFFSVGLVS